MIWRATYETKKDADRVGMKSPVVTLLLRDRTVYFLMLLVLNIVELILNLLNVEIDIPYLLYSLQCVVISRFFLNIRQSVQTRPETQPEIDDIKTQSLLPTAFRRMNVARNTENVRGAQSLYLSDFECSTTPVGPQELVRRDVTGASDLEGGFDGEVLEISRLSET